MDVNAPSGGGACRAEHLNRRDFIGWLIKGGLLTTLAGMILPALAYVWPVMRRGPAGGMQEVGKLEDFPVWSGKKVIIGGSAVLVLRTPNDVKAYSAICTHLGCIVEWQDSKREIFCPCHAGVFNVDGQVVSGPPPRPLPSYKTRVADGKIFVII